MISATIILCTACLLLDFFTVFVVEICATFFPSFSGALLLIFYLFLFVCTAISYFRTVRTDPGFIPRNWAPHKHSRRRVDVTYCRKCHCTQVPLSYHCQTCSKCILRMDHHSVWVNNCIGAGNQKYYILLVLYTLLLCIFTMICGALAIVSLVKSIQQMDLGSSWSIWLGVKLTSVIFSFTYSFAWTILILPTLPTTFYCLIKNTTSLERLQALDIYHTTDPSHRRPVHYVYDSGSWVANLKYIMGRNPLLWIIPISAPLPTHPEDWMDGLQSRRSRNHDQFAPPDEDELQGQNMSAPSFPSPSLSSVSAPPQKSTSTTNTLPSAVVDPDQTRLLDDTEDDDRHVVPSSFPAPSSHPSIFVSDETSLTDLPLHTAPS